MDKYCEQLTKAYKSGLYGFYTSLMVLMALIFVFTMSAIFPFSLIFAGLAVLFYFLKQREYVEYEYIFTNGGIDIDKIIEAKRRKKVISFDMQDVQIMAPVGSIHLDGAPKGNKIVAHSKKAKEQVFKAVISQGSAIKEIYFIPNEEFVNLCFRSNPKVVKKS